MRQRLPSPVAPFDIVPPHVVDTAKLIFTLLRSTGNGRTPLADMPADWMGTTYVR